MTEPIVVYKKPRKNALKRQLGDQLFKPVKKAPVMSDELKAKITYYKNKMLAREKLLTSLCYHNCKDYHNDTVWKMYQNKIDDIQEKYRESLKKESL